MTLAHMEPRQQSNVPGPVSSQYYDNEHRNFRKAPLTDKRQPFSARAEREVGYNDSTWDAPKTGSQQHGSRSRGGGRQGSTQGQPREPLAALHVPRLDLKLETDLRDANQAGLSPLSPLSPYDLQLGHTRSRGSVPDRSPLQKLEGKLDDISKEEKRARVEEAEHRARERKMEKERKRAAANQSRKVDSQPEPAITQAHPPSTRSHGSTGQIYATGGTRHASRPDDRYMGRGSLDIGGESSQPAASRLDQMQTNQAFDAGNKFRRASDALRTQKHNRNDAGPCRMSHELERSQQQASGAPSANDAPGRTGSGKYRHRARDAGFAGAAASSLVGGHVPYSFDKRDDQRGSSDQRSSASFSSLGRSDSKRLQKSDAPQDYGITNRRHDQTSNQTSDQQGYSSDRFIHKPNMNTAAEQYKSGSVHHDQAHMYNPHGPEFRTPSSTLRDQRAGGQVDNGPAPRASVASATASTDQHHRLGNFFHNHHSQSRAYQRRQALEEWRNAGSASLRLDDFKLDDSVASQRHGSNDDAPGLYDGHFDEEAKEFRPPLWLKCGPLLRYTGMRREKVAAAGRTPATDREIWRGSVMIVTLDSHSTYDSAPTLRLFSQPMDISTSLNADLHGNQHGRPVRHTDPITGQIKVGRTGQPLYVKPVDELQAGVDVSQFEDESGLFGATRPLGLDPQPTNGPNHQEHRHATIHNRSRIRRRDGEKTGKYREVKAARLHADQGVTFWRFNLEIELGHAQARVAYRINRGPSVGFWVPARGESMNIMFHSCNGFSLSVDPNLFSGPDPLWRDVLNKHQSKPFHVMLGGGDQIYNDAATRDTELFRDWLQIRNPEHKRKAEFTEQMQDELEAFYLNRYSMWFSRGLFGLANAQIPMVNIYDDHDIIDGFGSYPHHFMNTKVFAGLGAVAFKYYMLFQHQSVVSETQRDEPSWLLGASPGPYINELSRSVFMYLGRKIAFLGLDCRTERMRDEILSQETYDNVFDRCRTEIIKGETKHLIVLLGVPIAYPRLNFLENILTSRVMDPIKAIGRTGVLGGFVNKFDGGVEILDDLDDHWTAKHHKAERNWFIQELQELAAEKSVRVTILGGDVHLGAVGQFYSRKKLGVSKDHDHRYMPNVISSAIVNTPPPTLMGDVLNKRNKIHHLDTETDEDMIPMFEQDVDGKARNNLHLLPRRNFCTIREYIPGSTPPPSPEAEAQTQESSWTQSQETGFQDRPYPPGSMKRTHSLSGGAFRPSNLIRRLSGSRTREPTKLAPDQTRQYETYENGSGNVIRAPERRRSESGHDTRSEERGSYFPPQSQGSTVVRPTNAFRRRPTDLTEKAALKAVARGGAEGNVESHEPGHIDLEGGLDIALNMEVNQRDPAGITVPYRLLVPALWYDGQGDVNTATIKSKGPSLLDRLRGRGKDRGLEDQYSDSGSDSRASSLERQQDDRHGGDRSADSRPEVAVTRGDMREPVTRGFDGTNDLRNKEYGPSPSSRHPAISSNKEYIVSPPPLAATHPSQGYIPQERRRNNILGFRRQDPATAAYSDSDSESDGSITGSEVDSIEHDRLQQQQQQQQNRRRPSKTGRFFGVGDDKVKPADDRRQSTHNSPYNVQQELGPNGLPYEGAKKGWRLWR